MGDVQPRPEYDDESRRRAGWFVKPKPRSTPTHRPRGPGSVRQKCPSLNESRARLRCWIRRDGAARPPVGRWRETSPSSPKRKCRDAGRAATRPSLPATPSADRDVTPSLLRQNDRLRRCDALAARVKLGTADRPATSALSTANAVFAFTRVQMRVLCYVPLRHCR
jgi:hypothetical protein